MERVEVDDDRDGENGIVQNTAQTTHVNPNDGLVILTFTDRIDGTIVPSKHLAGTTFFTGQLLRQCDIESDTFRVEPLTIRRFVRAVAMNAWLRSWYRVLHWSCRLGLLRTEKGNRYRWTDWAPIYYTWGAWKRLSADDDDGGDSQGRGLRPIFEPGAALPHTPKAIIVSEDGDEPLDDERCVGCQSWRSRIRNMVRFTDREGEDRYVCWACLRRRFPMRDVKS